MTQNNKLSWVLTKELDTLPQLFYGVLNTYYFVKVYVCSCGDNKIIIGNDNDIDYICTECGNEEFFDANYYNSNKAWYDSIDKIFKEDILHNLPYEINLDTNHNKLNAKLLIEIPSSIDLSKDEVVFTKKPLYELILSLNGTIDEKVYVNFDLLSLSGDNYYFNYNESELINKHNLLVRFKLHILKYIISNKYFKNIFKGVLSQCTTIEHISFFLKNQHLREFDFTKWNNVHLLPDNMHYKIIDALNFVANNREEKSLKKAIYLNYKLQLSRYKSYDFIYHWIVSRYILDANIASRLIELDFKKHCEYIYDTFALEYFMGYLTQHYTYKQIEKLFIEYSKNEEFWFVHAVDLFGELDALSQENFNKISPLRYDNLHDEIVKYHRLNQNQVLLNLKFNYNYKQFQGVSKVEQYTIKLPQDGLELYNWSNALDNCLAGYGNVIKRRQTTVYGFFIDDKIKFAVEIKNNKLIQAKSKHNQNLDPKDMSLVKSWFDLYIRNIQVNEL